MISMSIFMLPKQAQAEKSLLKINLKIRTMIILANLSHMLPVKMLKSLFGLLREQEKNIVLP